MLELATGVAGRPWQRPGRFGPTSWLRRSSLQAAESSQSQREGKEKTMSLIDLVEEKERKTDLEPFGVGDTIKVHVIIKEGDKERIQVFKGDVISKRGSGLGASFTVRKVSFGVGVERIFPLHAKSVKKVEIVKKGKVRRAKLYYLRDLKGKAAKLREVR
jgi:large subunit ribosomal protein L19